MSGSYLLDTNIVIGLLAADPNTLNNFQKAGEVYTSSIVVGELNFGARKSSRVQENLARINDFVQSVTVLACDTETAWHYGNIKNQIRLKGKPIPENDIWIAAICAQYDLVLVSRDAHFNGVDDLHIEGW